MLIRTLRSAKFLIKGPIILVVLFFINLFTSPGEWWVQWAALGIGIAWIFALIRVIWALIIGGGLAALMVYLMNRRGSSAGTATASGAPQGGASQRPPDITVTPIAKQ